MLRQELNPVRSSAHNPLFQTIAQTLPAGEQSASDRDTLEGVAGGGNVAIDLWMNLVEGVSDEFNGSLTYDSAIFTRKRAQQIGQQFVSALRVAVDTPDEMLEQSLSSTIGTKSELLTANSFATGGRCPVIDCGSVKVSPFEVEDVLCGHPAVYQLAAFPVPHRTLGEAIGIALVLRPGGGPPDVQQLRTFTAAKSTWLLEVLVLMPTIPTNADGKVARVGLAARLGLPMIHPGSQQLTWKVTGDAAGATGQIRTVAVCRAAQPAAVGHASAQPAAPQGSDVGTLLVAVMSAVRKVSQREDVTPTTPLMDAGIDSLSATQLAIEIGASTGVSLSPLLIFQYSTPDGIATYLSEQLVPPVATQEISDSQQESTTCRPITRVTGAAMRWPCGMTSERELLTMAVTAFDTVGEVPLSRWAVDDVSRLQYPAVRYVSHMPGAELFDVGAFGISVAEVTWMDPQQRLLLEAGYSSLHDADFGRQSLLAHAIGVMVGIQATDYMIKAANSKEQLPVHAVSGSTFSVAAGRLSFVLGLQGPCYSTDTACSTALVAAHAASQMVCEPGCEGALTLAINMTILPLGHMRVAVAAMTSPDGRCKFLDSRANGYVRSEGLGAVLLQPESEIAESVDRFMWLRGTAVRSDGRSASLTAPNGKAQVRLMRAAMLYASTPPGDIQTVESHGTGTALGDPVETTAQRETLLSHGRREQSLVIAGVKANMGHMEPSAGMVGLLKLRASLRSVMNVPNPQLRMLNPHVEGGSCSLLLQTARTQADPEASAGLSSFGYAGTIAHVVLRQAPSKDAEDTALVTSKLPVSVRRAFPWQPPIHPFAQQSLSSGDAAVAFRSAAVGALHDAVADHVLQGRIIFPGTGYLEMARASIATRANGTVALHGVYFLKPLAVERPGLLVECSMADGQFEVRSGEAGQQSILADVSVHCSGAGETAAIDGELIDQAFARGPRTSHMAEVCAFYDLFNSMGLQYGPGFRRVAQAWARNGGAANARLLPRTTKRGMQVHPADLDDAVCISSLAAGGGNGDGTRIPYAVDEAMLQGAHGELWAVSLQM